MERFIIRLGRSNPSRGLNQSTHSSYYLYDGDYATLARNPDLDQNILRALETMLRTHNPFPKTFHFAYEVLQTARVESVPLHLHEDCYGGRNGSESV
jgi:hypothetical protein